MNSLFIQLLFVRVSMPAYVYNYIYILRYGQTRRVKHESVKDKELLNETVRRETVKRIVEQTVRHHGLDRRRHGNRLALSVSCKPSRSLVLYIMYIHIYIYIYTCILEYLCAFSYYFYVSTELYVHNSIYILRHGWTNRAPNMNVQSTNI